MIKMDFSSVEIEMDVVGKTIQELLGLVSVGASLIVDNDLLDSGKVAIGSKINKIFKLIVWHVKHKQVVNMSTKTSQCMHRHFI